MCPICLEDQQNVKICSTCIGHDKQICAPCCIRMLMVYDQIIKIECPFCRKINDISVFSLPYKNHAQFNEHVTKLVRSYLIAKQLNLLGRVNGSQTE